MSDTILGKEKHRMSVPLFPPQPVQALCPNCGMPITIQLYTIVDGGREPELKRRLLEGELNVTVCPACRRREEMIAPLLYHDGAKEFLAVFLPPQIAKTEAERQQIIGNMTTALMNSLPPQQRKGYLFQPKQFLTLSSLLDAILYADGVTPEQLRAHRERLHLIQRLLDAQAKEDVLQAIVKEHDEKLDYDFFALLSGIAEEQMREGDELKARQVLALRDRLLDMSSWGRSVGEVQREALKQLGGVLTVEQLVDKFIQAEDEAQVEQLTLLARPLIDYNFFQVLTARMEAAAQEGKKQEARRLRALRTRVLNLIDKMDKEDRREVNRAVRLLRRLLRSDDALAAVREHFDEIDDVVMAVLSMNLQEAERRGLTEVVEQLQAIWRAIMVVIEESMPPEMRLINRLLEAKFPEETQALLEENRERVDYSLLKAMEEVSQDLERQGQLAVAKRLRDIRGQAVLMV